MTGSLRVWLGRYPTFVMWTAGCALGGGVLTALKAAGLGA